MATPINPVVSGLAHAMQFATMLKQQAMQQQAMELRKRREERDAKVQDLSTRMQLNAAGAKPLDAQGRAAYTTPNGLPQNIGGVDLPAPQMTTQVPANAGQVVDYGGQKYELPTYQQATEEQMRRQMEMLRATTDIKTQGAINQIQARVAADVVNLPGIGTVQSKAVPFYTAGVHEAGANVRQGQQQKFQSGENDKNRTSAEKRTSATIAGANQRNASTNATRWDIAEINNGGTGGGGSKKEMTPGQAATNTRVNAKRDDELSTQEYQLHQQRRTLGTALATPNGETYTDSHGRPVEMNELRRKQIQGQFDDATNRVNEIRKKRELSPVGEKGAAAPQAAPAQQKPTQAAQFKAGQRVMYQGKPHVVTGVSQDGKLQLKPE